MIAVDTNVLVRLIVQDDATQAAKARRVLDDRADADGSVWVSDTVLVELVWTLARTYRRSREEQLLVVRTLRLNSTIALESAEAIDTAISLFAGTAADFADCLLCAKASRIGCEALLTFDKGMKTLPGVSIIS